MKLLKLSTLVRLSLTFATAVAAIALVKRKVSADNLQPGNIDSSSDASSDTQKAASEKDDYINDETSRASHIPGDARYDKEELIKNQERLHVSANHKTKEMEEHGRGTFP